MEQLDQLIGAVDERIERLFPRSELTAPFYGMLKYHLGWADERLRPARADAGKRIRARLCFLACAAVGGRPEAALPAAAAVELIHNFSLVHDDIQDRSKYRRHRKTVWALWGEAQAINVGDELFVVAQLALAESDLPAVAGASRVLNNACRLLCEGQYLDLDFEHRPSISVAQYYAMIERKTAALIEAACHLGALFGGGPEPATSRLAEFGRNLGLAFQVRDDYLGIWGDPAQTGKPAADDVASKKKTLPLLYAMERSEPSARGVLTRIFSQPGQATGQEVEQVLEMLEACGAPRHTEEEAERMTKLALAALARSGDQTDAHIELAAICRNLAGRTA